VRTVFDEETEKKIRFVRSSLHIPQRNTCSVQTDDLMKPISFKSLALILAEISAYNYLNTILIDCRFTMVGQIHRTRFFAFQLLTLAKMICF
jgi:hypothetical protein